jgi:hypothetical protein
VTLDEAKLALANFLEANTKSAVIKTSGDKGVLVVQTPWGDSSILLRLPDDPAALIDALNNLLLPERFTALWHKDTNDIEFIYTAYPLNGTQWDVRERKFNFTFRGKEYRCEFARSSDRLLTIAENSMFVGPSNSEHRNLPSAVRLT